MQIPSAVPFLCCAFLPSRSYAAIIAFLHHEGTQASAVVHVLEVRGHHGTDMPPLPHPPSWPRPPLQVDINAQQIAQQALFNGADWLLPLHGVPLLFFIAANLGGSCNQLFKLGGSCNQLFKPVMTSKPYE
jgi:hypothetical protein